MRVEQSGSTVASPGDKATFDDAKADAAAVPRPSADKPSAKNPIPPPTIRPAGDDTPRAANGMDKPATANPIVRPAGMDTGTASATGKTDAPAGADKAPAAGTGDKTAAPAATDKPAAPGTRDKAAAPVTDDPGTTATDEADASAEADAPATSETRERFAEAAASAARARGRTLSDAQKEAIRPYTDAAAQSDEALITQAGDALSGKETPLPVALKAAPADAGFLAATSGDTVYVSDTAARGGAAGASAEERAEYADTLREEITEAGYQKALGGTSEGDFGQEVVTRAKGDFASLSDAERTALRERSDTVTFVDGDGARIEGEARGTNTRVGNERDNTITAKGLDDGAGVTLRGKGGDDKLFGGRLGDRLFGGDGTDVIRGYGGQDVIQTGGKGDDVVYAGRDNDTIQILRNESGLKIVLGGQGTDTLELKGVRRSEARVTTDGDVTVVKFGDYTAHAREVEKLKFADRTQNIDPGAPVNAPGNGGGGGGRAPSNGGGTGGFAPIDGGILHRYPRDLTGSAQAALVTRAQQVSAYVGERANDSLTQMQNLDNLLSKNLNDYPSSSNDVGVVLNLAKQNVDTYNEFVGEMSNALDGIIAQDDLLERRGAPLGLRQELLSMASSKVRNAYDRIRTQDLGPALWNAVRNETLAAEDKEKLAQVFAGIATATSGLGAFTGINGLLTATGGAASAIAGVGIATSLLGASTGATSFDAIAGVPGARNFQGSNELNNARSLSIGLPTLLARMDKVGLTVDKAETERVIARGAEQAQDFTRQTRLLMDVTIMSQVSVTSAEHVAARNRIGGLGYNVYSLTRDAVAVRDSGPNTFYIETPNASGASPASGDSFAGSRAISIRDGKIKPGDHMPHTQRKGDWSGKILGNDPTTRGDPDKPVKGRYYLIAGYWKDDGIEVRNVNRPTPTLK